MGFAEASVRLRAQEADLPHADGAPALRLFLASATDEQLAAAYVAAWKTIDAIVAEHRLLAQIAPSTWFTANELVRELQMVAAGIRRRRLALRAAMRAEVAGSGGGVKLGPLTTGDSGRFRAGGDD